MKHVLVTGGAGFIGANLCKKLLDEGCKVTAIDNLITSSGKNLTELSKNPNFKFIKHDITKPLPSSIINHKSLIRHIFHLACPTGVPNLTKFAEEMLLTCSIGTLNILEFAKKQKAKLIFTSSSEVYGDPKKFPQREDYTGNVDPRGVRSPYEEGKRFSESLIATYVRRYNLDAKIVRLFNTYGPGASKKETRVVSAFLRNAKANRNLIVTGDGSQTRTFCYVDDLIDALLLVAERGKRGEAYNAGGDVEISIAQLAKLIIDITHSKSQVMFIKRPNHDHNRRLPDLSKIQALGWSPTTFLEEGLKKSL